MQDQTKNASRIELMEEDLSREEHKAQSDIFALRNSDDQIDSLARHNNNSTPTLGGTQAPKTKHRRSPSWRYSPLLQKENKYRKCPYCGESLAKELIDNHIKQHELELAQPALQDSIQTVRGSNAEFKLLDNNEQIKA